MLTQSAGFRHRPVQRDGEQLGVAEEAMQSLAEATGEFQVDCSQDARRDVTRGNLQNYDVVMFYTTGDLPIAPDDLDYLIEEWIPASGHGFLGVHSATDTLKDYRPYWDMIGGTFNGHPWGQNTPVTIAVRSRTAESRVVGRTMAVG
jgi:type 1 glutamine amidotransferase